LAACLATEASAQPQPQPARAPQPVYLASRQILIEYDTADRTEVQPDLWVSTDRGRSWLPADPTPRPRSLLYTAPADGRYEFYLVLRDHAGRSTLPPDPGSTPLATCIVDTLPPLLQVHAAEVQTSANAPPKLILRLSLVEENLAADGVRIFYRSHEQPWTDGGPVTLLDDHAVWTTPPQAGPVLSLRVIATDRAGNSCAAELPQVFLPTDLTNPAKASAASPTTQAVEPRATGTNSQPSGSKPQSEVTASPLDASSGQPDPQPSSTTTDVRRLRAAAAIFLSQGQYDLAAARLEDALALSPPDPDLLVHLGYVLHRLGRYDQATQRFESALKLLPDYAEALEGLALVAATQKRYALAQQYMQHLQRLRPESGQVWLRSGDIEHRLGNLPAALAAWKRVLTVSQADAELQQKARRRLEYFGLGVKTGDRLPSSTSPTWLNASEPHRLSSSTATTPTRNPPP